ncbi:MAG: gluconate 5-dehydrogenase [Burkholderiales bacterium]
MHQAIRGLFDLSGRVALVTGGNSGIGRSLALALGRAGARTLLVARRAEELDAAVREFAADGIEAHALAADLTDRASIAALPARAIAAAGAPDVLVNAAGVNIRKPFPDLDDADWDATLALNLTAPFLLTRAFAPALAARGRGRNVHIASQQAVRAFANSGPYGASKGGIMQLTRATAEYWSRRGVTCNAIAPGFFPTPLTGPVFADPARARAMADRTMIGRNGELDDLAGTVVWLASDASAYVTGQTIFVDGGFSAG